MSNLEKGFWFDLVVRKVPVTDYLKLRTLAGQMTPDDRVDISRSAQAVELTLHGKPETVLSPAVIMARSFASKVSLDKYLDARKNYVGKTIEEFNDWFQNDSSPFLATEGILHDKEILEAESAMLKTIVQALAEHPRKH